MYGSFATVLSPTFLTLVGLAAASHFSFFESSLPNITTAIRNASSSLADAQTAMAYSFLLAYYLATFLLSVATFLYYCWTVMMPSFDGSDFYQLKRRFMRQHVFFLFNHHNNPDSDDVYVSVQVKAFLIFHGMFMFMLFICSLEPLFVEKKRRWLTWFYSKLSWDTGEDNLEKELDLFSLHRSSQNDFFFPQRLHMTCLMTVISSFTFCLLAFFVLKGNNFVTYYYFC
jgi:hypothetical protein